MMQNNVESLGHPLLDESRKHHPRVLRRNVIEALNKLEEAIKVIGCDGDALLWLRRYREYKSECAVPWYGTYPALAPFVIRLHDSYVSINTYDHNDYVSQDAAAEVRSKTGKGGGRPKVVSDEEILQWLMEAGYANSENKKRLQIEALEQIGVGKTRLLQVAKKNNLTKPKCSKPNK
jgi:hypothetical protein